MCTAVVDVKRVGPAWGIPENRMGISVPVSERGPHVRLSSGSESSAQYDRL